MMTYHFTADHVLHELPALQGHALIAAALELDPRGLVQRASPGYIAQELHST